MKICMLAQEFLPVWGRVGTYIVGDGAFNFLFDFLERVQLVKLRQKAMRVGVWFKALSRIDRVLVDVAIKVADTIRSPQLAKSLLAITGKLEQSVESKFTRTIREVGLPLTAKLSQYAMQWGYHAAAAWANDIVYAQFLAAMRLNGHSFTG